MSEPKELPYLAELFGFKRVYISPKGSLVLVLEKEGKQIYREVEDIWRFIENVDRFEPPLVSELMLNILYERLLKIKEEMEKEAEQI